MGDLTPNQVETIRKHVTVFAASLTALPASQESQEQQSDTYTAPQDSMALVASQGLQTAKEAGLDISRGALDVEPPQCVPKSTL